MCLRRAATRSGVSGECWFMSPDRAETAGVSGSTRRRAACASSSTASLGCCNRERGCTNRRLYGQRTRLFFIPLT